MLVPTGLDRTRFLDRRAVQQYSGLVRTQICSCHSSTEPDSGDVVSASNALLAIYYDLPGGAGIVVTEVHCTKRSRST